MITTEIGIETETGRSGGAGDSMWMSYLDVRVPPVSPMSGFLGGPLW